MRTKHKNKEVVHDDVDAMQQNSSNDDEDPLFCIMCKKRFVSLKTKNLHVCQGGRSSIDMVTVGLRHAVSLIESGKVDYINTNKELSNDLDFSKNLEVDLENMLNGMDGFEEVPFSQGWARRPAYGHCYGKKYIENFVEQIDDMFMKGINDKRQKMGPALMREGLCKMYPERYDIPSETEIRQRISTLFTKYKKTGSIVSRRKPTHISEPYQSTIVHILESHTYNIKPKEALELFKEIHTGDEDEEEYPDEKMLVK